jgi:alkaline phosphatase D
VPRRLLLLTLAALAALALAACEPAPDADAPAPRAVAGDTASDAAVTRLAFGSCNRTTLPQPLWAPILAQDPDVWMWMGDNIYADTQDMSVMQALYDRQKAHPGYRRVREAAAVIGTWDDHDYGVNDGGRAFPRRDSSQTLLLDFLDVPPDDPRRDRAGVYSAHTFGPPGQRVKVLLLDTRYHRDPLARDTTGRKRYAPTSGDMLGAAQWAWLEDQLTGSDAQVHVLGSSIQVVPDEHGYEKWANLPEARARLFATIRRSGAPGVVLVSGDRHIAEFSRLPASDTTAAYPLYELTASGLTHSWEGASGEPNRFRQGPLIGAKNYGLLALDWDAGTLTFQVRALADASDGAPSDAAPTDRVAFAHTVALADLQP